MVILDNIKSQVKSMNLSNYVVFLGEISPEEVTKFLSRTDVYIQLSIEENRIVEGGSYNIRKEWALCSCSNQFRNLDNRWKCGCLA